MGTAFHMTLTFLAKHQKKKHLQQGKDTNKPSRLVIAWLKVFQQKRHLAEDALVQASNHKSKTADSKKKSFGAVTFMIYLVVCHASSPQELIVN